MKSILSKNSIKNEIKENYNKDNKSNFNNECRNYLINIKKSLLKKRISKKRQIIESCKNSVKTEMEKFSEKKNKKDHLLKLVSPRIRENFKILRKDNYNYINNSISNKRLIYESNVKSENFKCISLNEKKNKSKSDNLSKSNNVSVLQHINPARNKPSIYLIKKRLLKNIAKKIFPLNKYGILLIRSIIRDLNKMVFYKKKKEFFGISYNFDKKIKIKKKFFEKEKFIIFFEPNNFFFKEKNDFIRNKKIFEINEKGFKILSKNKDFFKFIFLVSKSKKKSDKFFEIVKNLAYFKRSINQVIQLKNKEGDLKNIKTINIFNNININRCILLDSKLENYLFNTENFVYFPKFLTNNNFKEFNNFLVDLIKKIKKKDFTLKILNDKYSDLLTLK